MHGAATQLRNESNNNYLRKGSTVSAVAIEQHSNSHMLGAAAFRLSVCSGNHSTKLHTTKGICRHPSSSSLRSCSTAWVDKYVKAAHSSGGFNCHSSSCLLGKDGGIGATIWHALLPSCFINPDDRRKLAVTSGSGSVLASLKSEFFPVSRVERRDYVGMSRRFATSVCHSDGSWNVALDARPARWLHGRHSVWLLFGFCSCFSTALSAVAAATTPTTITYCEAEPKTAAAAAAAVADMPIEEGKKVYKDYSVIGIPGDGRCLFRAVAHGSCARSGKPPPDETLQRDLADELRGKVMDELVKRREESEWFIEGDFDEYVERMRETHVWGGEPELLMLSHVLKMPITVYMADRNNSKDLISIAEYGQEYGKEDPIKVLYHGFGHYDALQMPKLSKL